MVDLPKRLLSAFTEQPVAAAAPLAVLSLLLTGGLAAQGVYHIAPPAPWVKPMAALTAAPIPAAPVTEGFETLLIDRQEAVRGPRVERFMHAAYRLLNEEAVQQYSQIELVADSSYEHLVLHTVRVTRNGRTRDQLQASRIRVVQRESQIDSKIFEGSLSVIVVLEDVRRGDVVDYSYTRLGGNPVFAGHYMSTFVLQETVPLHHVAFRLLWPLDRALFVDPRQTNLKPAVHDVAGYREYVWNDTHVSPKVLDANLPTWYNALPQIRLSDFASWSAVAAWGDTLFASTAAVPPALAAPLAQIRRTQASALARVLAALRYVQDEIRYVGIEIGVNSHVPHPPATVMRRRYGDCKDKVLLLITMLRALGVVARPALVSTDYLEHIRTFHPSANLFDHAIVQAELDGRVYWLDPTERYQRGDLVSGIPFFGAALVLGRQADSLSTIPRSPLVEPLTDVAVSLELRGVDSAARMRVETRYRGRQADLIRTSIRTTSAEELRRDYTNFYSQLYPAIRSDVAPAISDDETANQIQTTERYSVPGFWHFSRGENGYVGTFEPLELSNAVPVATGASRTMPLAVAHPRHIHYAITARLAEGWRIAPEHEKIETSAVRFAYDLSVEGSALTLTYDYLTLADHVLPGAVADHLEKLARLRKLLVFVVTPPTKPATVAAWLNPREVNWPILLAALFAAGVAVFGAARLTHTPVPVWLRGPVQAGSEPGRPGGPSAFTIEPRGLGGWLILVGFGVIVTPLRILVMLVKNAPMYTVTSWAQLTTPSESGYHVLWAPTWLFELVANVALLVFASVLVWQFFRRRRWFPALFVVFTTARVSVELLDFLLANAIPLVKAKATTNWSTDSGSLLAAVVWVAYMFRSRRVQNTFVT